MAKPLTPAEVHKQYDEAMTAYRRLLADPGSRVAFGRESDAFMRQCACGLWQADMGLTPLHVEFYNAIYVKGNTVPTVLYWELTGKVQDYPGFVLPNFFRRIVQADQERNESRSRRFVETFTLMMLLFAAVDGKVSASEASFISACQDSMSRFCDKSGIQGGKAPLDLSDFVARKEDGSPVATGRPQDEKIAPPPVSPKGKTHTPSADEPSLNELLDEMDRFLQKDYFASLQNIPPLQTDTPAEKQPEKPAPTPAPAPEAVQADQPAPAEPEPTLEELLAELDSLCGLEKVKEDVKGLINLVKVRKLREQHGLPVPPLSLHLVFMGNPGTGKTTVARLLGKLYHAIGVLSKGQLIEVDRSGLVAGFVGQTALKAQEVVSKAMGGILFIDEAYALTNQENPNDFGQEAVEVILKAMEDHRDDLIVIVAGYTDLMINFIHSNPGLESRFNKYISFEDYNGKELAEIFRSMCKKNGYTLAEDVDKAAEEAFQLMFEQRDENFGNARDVRNVFENAVARQANRLAALDNPTKEDLMALTLSDLDLQEEKPDGAAKADAPAEEKKPAKEEDPA